jgi:hypothetical protein
VYWGEVFPLVVLWATMIGAFLSALVLFALGLLVMAIGVGTISVAYGILFMIVAIPFALIGFFILNQLIKYRRSKENARR